MKKLFEKLEKIELERGEYFSFDLEREFNLISKFINKKQSELLKSDFECFVKKRKHLLYNAIAGGIMFLKVPERIEEFKVEYLSKKNKLILSLEFSNEKRKKENIKYDLNAGKIKSINWNIEIIFPHFSKYQDSIKIALLILLGKMIKIICEDGRTTLAYMKIENEFEIKILIDNQLKSKLIVRIT